MIDEMTRANPRYRELVGHYRAARRHWRENVSIRVAAQTLGMSERRYCDYYVGEHFSPVVLTPSTSTIRCNEYWNTGAWDAAFAEAAGRDGGAPREG
jgi:hypothetical protein